MCSQIPGAPHMYSSNPQIDINYHSQKYETKMLLTGINHFIYDKIKTNLSIFWRFKSTD